MRIDGLGKIIKVPMYYTTSNQAFEEEIQELIKGCIKNTNANFIDECNHTYVYILISRRDSGLRGVICTPWEYEVI